MKSLFKHLAHALLGDYAIYHIYSAAGTPAVPGGGAGEFAYGPVERAQLEASDSSLLREQVDYLGVGAQAYGCWHDAVLVGLCVYWFGDRYRTRNFWPLQDGEAKLVQIVVLSQMRGKGAASRLIARSQEDMLRRGFRRTYARIWHSNLPSLRAFERAGWGRIATVVEVNPLRLSKPWRISAPHRGQAAADGA